MNADSKHRIFLGSSTESRWVARAIEGLLHEFGNVKVDAWYHFGSWPAGKATLETLEERLRGCDFAVFVLSEDDWTQSRSDAPRPAPRDNVVFELGFFMGHLGRDRAFFFFPKSRDFKVPSDLFGITGFPYEIDDRVNPSPCLSPECTKIMKQVEVVARDHRAKGMMERPKLMLKAEFPKDHGLRTDNLKHLPASTLCTLKVTVAIDDPFIDNLRIYFPPRLNLRKSGWAYAEDDGGRHFWVSAPQLTEMKESRGLVSFDVDQPQRGSYEVTVTAMSERVARYQKVFVVNVS